MKSRAALSVAALLVIAFAPLAEAQDETWRKDRFRLGVGMYWPDFETEIRADNTATGEGGTLLNLEQDLDLSDRKTQIMLAGHWRIAKRHAIEFDWVDLSRSDETTVGFRFDYDGRVIEVSEDIVTTFNTEVFRLGYRFSFINSNKHELSVALGLHVTDLKVGINLVDEEDEEFDDVTAPLPTLGGAWKYHFNDQWTFHIRGEWLDIEIDEVDGSLTSGIAEVMWYPWRNFGFSLGYHIWDFDVSVSDDDIVGTMEYRYDGPKLNLNLRF